MLHILYSSSTCNGLNAGARFCRWRCSLFLFDLLFSDLFS